MGAVGQRHAPTSLPPGNEPTVAIPDTALSAVFAASFNGR